MRLKTYTMLAVLTIALAGCVAPQRQTTTATAPAKAPHAFKPINFKHDAKQPEASNFARQLDLPIFQCELEAQTGSYAVRYGNRQGIDEYSQSLLDCYRHARAEGDAAIARLKAASVPKTQSELAKVLYAKWSAYLGTISPYTRTDIRAKSEYRAAKEALATEVKFSQ